MENFVQDPLAINVSSGADSSHEIHLQKNMGEISYALPSPNPFDQEKPIDGGVIQVKGSCRCFSLDEVLIATNDFDDALVVGAGGFGKVYKGSINDGVTTTVVAIKRLNAQSNQGAEEFWTEVKLLSKFHHTNLVSLIGYCNENQEMILIYKYIARGTLASDLYKSGREESGKSVSHLTWAQRLNICLGAARGLNYLHTGTEQLIILRDMKSTNILLDKNWVAKVSDFGISKCITSQTTTHVSTLVKATRGYWDPEYFISDRVTRKSDVYAFGVVLLEVLCGRPPIDERLEEEQSSLILWAKMYIRKEKLDRIIDPSLNGEMISPESLKYVAELAYNCLHIQPNERPTMAGVVESLDIALASHECKGRLQGTIAKAFRGIKIVPKHMNRSWRAGKSLGSNDGEEPILDDLTRSVYSPFSLPEIRAATDDFDDGLLIGQDTWFRLYKGSMVGGTLAFMIKRYESREAHMARLVSAEIKVQSLTPHPNIISLIGFCEEKHELILVYDYMVNGTLRSHLHRRDNSPLNWKKLLEICIDTARGLEYLHMNVEQQFIHRDIKPSNVFLDNEWVAKISEFEISVQIRTGMSTKGVEKGLTGTRGYLNPEYLHTNKVSKKADVYAFGVMLLEVLCAKTPFSPNRYGDEVWLRNWFRECIERGTIDEIIDPYLIGKIAPECFRHYVNIALSCLAYEGIRRPSMNVVLGSLQSSLQMQEAWENFFEMGDVPRSYNDVISVENEFTIGEQSYLISDLVPPWSTARSSSGYSSSSK